MSQIKICPSCGFENSLSETMCSRCMADISSVSPEGKIQDDSSVTVIEAAHKNILQLESSDGSVTLSVENGAILGREAYGQNFLMNYKTVSRRHAKFIFSEKWTVEDLNSTNGTWVNERKLERDEKCALKSGDIVALSRSCVFAVK